MLTCRPAVPSRVPQHGPSRAQRVPLSAVPEEGPSEPNCASRYRLRPPVCIPGECRLAGLKVAVCTDRFSCTLLLKRFICHLKESTRPLSLGVKSDYKQYDAKHRATMLDLATRALATDSPGEIQV